MHIHIETYLVQDGQISRIRMYRGTMNAEEINNLPTEFLYDNGKLGKEQNKIHVFHVASLEDHEREEIENKKKQNS